MAVPCALILIGLWHSATDGCGFSITDAGWY